MAKSIDLNILCEVVLGSASRHNDNIYMCTVKSIYRHISCYGKANVENENLSLNIVIFNFEHIRNFTSTRPRIFQIRNC